MERIGKKLPSSLAYEKSEFVNATWAGCRAEPVCNTPSGPAHFLSLSLSPSLLLSPLPSSLPLYTHRHTLYTLYTPYTLAFGRVCWLSVFIRLRFGWRSSGALASSWLSSLTLLLSPFRMGVLENGANLEPIAWNRVLPGSGSDRFHRQNVARLPINKVLVSNIRIGSTPSGRAAENASVGTDEGGWPRQ